MRNENNRGVTIIVCLCTMMIITEEQSVDITEFSETLFFSITLENFYNS